MDELLETLFELIAAAGDVGVSDANIDRAAYAEDEDHCFRGRVAIDVTCKVKHLRRLNKVLARAREESETIMIVLSQAELVTTLDDWAKDGKAVHDELNGMRFFVTARTSAYRVVMHSFDIPKESIVFGAKAVQALQKLPNGYYYFLADSVQDVAKIIIEFRKLNP